MKKVLVIGSIVFVVLLGFVVLAFYLALRTKKVDVSDINPFSMVVNQKLTTKRRVLIIKDLTPPMNDNYPYILEDGSFYGMDSGLEVLADLPIGTIVEIDKTIIYVGGVSGAPVPYLFGKLYDKASQKEYRFQYNWGLIIIRYIKKNLIGLLS